MVLALTAPVDADPLVAFVPVQPWEAVQLVAFVELHDSVLAAPALTVVGEAVRVTVGAGVVVPPPTKTILSTYNVRVQVDDT